MNEQAVKRCIFHIPNYIEENASSASGIRPMKMLQAFRNIGYEVAVVKGYGKERKAAIKEIKANIKNGIRYEFMYSESSTMPTLLTERHHLPTYPCLDFSFFKFCKKHGIRIGLFYRDVYWKFDIYKNLVPVYKRIPAVLAYKHDLKQYKKYLTKFYLPTDKMYEYLTETNLADIQDELPPGCEYIQENINDRKQHWKDKEENSGLNVFYVGGLGSQYKMELLFKVVSRLKDIKLTVCCHEDQWKDCEEDYKEYLSDNIQIIHKQGKELKPWLKAADICSLFFEPDKYRDFAMPFKTFEYLSYGIPSIATTKTAVGRFVEQQQVGWTINYDEKSLNDFFEGILNDIQSVTSKSEHCMIKIQENTWESRARKVEEDLSYET